MQPELRPPSGEDEIAAWFAVEAAGFGWASAEPAAIADERTVLPTDRMLGVWVDGRPVATAGAYPFDLTLPGGVGVPVAGVCDVGVLPGHRRQGHLGRMVRRIHDDARDRGDAAAVLTSSDGSLYGRFGYGLATSYLCWQLDTARAALAEPPAAGYEVEVLRGVDGAAVLTDLWERCRHQRPGTLSRSLEWWRLVLGPRADWKGGGNVFTLVLRDDSGVRGAVAHRVSAEVVRGIQRWDVEPLDVVADAPEVEAALWHELIGMHHVVRLAPRLRPLDEPLRWRLRDPRQLQVTELVDLLWLCPLDVVTLLSRRHYATCTSLTLAVVDPFDPLVAGTYRLETRLDGGGCERVDGAEPDLRLSSDVLGGVLLGGTALSAYAAAGRVEERRGGAVTAFDAAFSSPIAPYNSTFF